MKSKRVRKINKVESACYANLTTIQRRDIRNRYKIAQSNLCFYCMEDLDLPTPEKVSKKSINWRLFPPYFLKYPIHLQHDHKTGMTEGAIHSYCNAVLWQYHGK